MDKPVLFLDVDGVLIGFPEDGDYQTHPEGIPAFGAKDFLEWAVEHMDCRWLTSWAPWGTMNMQSRYQLSEILGVPESLLEKFDHDHPWFRYKTYAIDYFEFKDGKPAFWIDDEAIPEEVRVLTMWGLPDILVVSDTSKDNMALMKTWEFLKEEVAQWQKKHGLSATPILVT